MKLTVAGSGGESNAYGLLIRDALAVIEDKEPNDGFNQVQVLSFPIAVEGTIRGERDVDVFRIEGKKGDKVRVQVLASRFGSPFDALITLHDSRGAILASADDSAGATHSDPELVLTLPSDGTYFISLIDAHDLGGANFGYRLVVRTVGPPTLASHVESRYAFIMPELTEEQASPVDHRDTSVVLSSGAGCGKTKVLTERFVSHLERNEASVGQIVAITFTDKAAREMRDRIRRQIEDLAKNGELADAKKHLRDLERAQITTIHSFCGNILRQFAIPAGLDPGFEVLEDVLSANLRADALTAGLHGLLEDRGDKKAADSLRELVIWFGYPAVVEAVDSLLLQVDRPGGKRGLRASPATSPPSGPAPPGKDLFPRWVRIPARPHEARPFPARSWRGSSPRARW